MGNVSWWVYALFPMVAFVGLMLAAYKKKPKLTEPTTKIGTYRIVPSIAYYDHTFAVQKYDNYQHGYSLVEEWRNVKNDFPAQKGAEEYILHLRLKEESDKIHLSIPPREVPPYKFIKE